MKLEIDMPSILYQDAKENRNYISLTKLEIAWKAIADGKPIEQEPILDKLRAEIDNTLSDGMIHKKTVLGIIDKYKAETETDNG